MNPVSMGMLVQEHENGLRSTVWQPTQTAASQMRISILWKLRVCTISTPIYGSLDPSATWYIDPISVDMLVQEHEGGLS